MNVPQLRFDGFKGDWEKVLFKDIFSEKTERTNDMSKYPLYSLTVEKGVTPKTDRYERSFLIKKESDNYKIVNPNDFVYNPMNLTLGAVAKHKKDINISVSGYYNVFSVSPRFNSDFLEMYLKSYKMILHYKSIATGSLIEKQRVHFSQFIKINKLIPSLKEQNKIGSFFVLLDRKIEMQQEKIQELHELKKGMMQKVFSQEIRFKDEDGKDYPKWRTYKLSELVSFFKGQALSKSDLALEGVPCVLYGQLYTMYGEIIDEVISKTQNNSGFNGEIGDVLIPSSGETAIDIACASALSKNALLGGDLNVLRPNKKLCDGKFLAYLLSNAYKNELSRLAQGASVVHLYNNSLKSLLINLPIIDEQQKIANTLICIDKKIKKETDKISELAFLKQAFIQQMFI